MLAGSVAGGFVAQVTNLGVPYVLRAVMLLVTLVVAFWFMHDLGFTPERGVSAGKAVRNVIHGAVDGGFRTPPVRWLMLAAPFTAGTGIYVFYAAQPYLLELYGDKTAYGIAGLAAAIVAGVQIVGGLTVSRVRRLFGRRTSALLIGGVLNVVLLVLLWLTHAFVIALLLLAGWSFVFAVAGPLRQAFINGIIPSEQRATVLSFDSLMGSAGGVIAQPALGRVADVNGYGPAYLVSAGVSALALPFIVLARREHASSDPIEGDDDAAPAEVRSA
jgi:MFS family permease